MVKNHVNDEQERRFTNIMSNISVNATGSNAGLSTNSSIASNSSEDDSIVFEDGNDQLMDNVDEDAMMNDEDDGSIIEGEDEDDDEVDQSFYSTNEGDHE